MPLPPDALTLTETQFAARYPDRYARMRAAGVSFADYIAAHTRLLAARLPTLPAAPVVTRYQAPGLPVPDRSAAARTYGAPASAQSRTYRRRHRRTPGGH